MVPEAQLQERMFPFDIEEHESLDIDQDRVPLIVDEHMIGSEFAVDEPVLGPRAHGGGKFAGAVLQLALRGCYSRDARGRLGKITQSAVQDDLFARAAGAGLTAGAGGAGGGGASYADLADAWAPMLVHGLQRSTEPCHCLARSGQIAL